MPLRYPLSSFRRGSGSQYKPLITPFQLRKKRRPWSLSEIVFVVIFVVTITIFYCFMFHYESRVASSSPVALRIAREREEKLQERAKDRGVKRRLFLHEVKQIQEPLPKNGANVALSETLANTKKNWTLFPTSEILGAKLVGDTRVQYLKMRCSAVEEVFYSSETGLSNCVWSNEMNVRKTIIQEGCSSKGEPMDRLMKIPTSIDNDRLLMLKYRKLVWCPVYKAASTLWMKWLPKLSNFSPQQLNKLKRLKRLYGQPNEIAHLVAPPLGTLEIHYFLSQKPKPVRFIIVRHPLERLLSAYRDKLEVTNTYFYETYGREIVEKFRPRYEERFGSDFQSPVDNPKRDEKQPTFWEFVMALVEDKKMDDHWRPITSQCSLCQMEYDFILKTENLKEEQEFMLRSIGLNSANLGPVDVKEHENRRRLRREEKLQYFQMLNETEMALLYGIYQYDFILFEYDLQLPRDN